MALQKISATGEKLKTVGDNISSAGQKLLPVTAGVTALGTAAVSTAANFESSMSQVQATMGITKDAMSTVNGESVNTMDTLSALAKKMGAETAFSASECAEALNYLALAGYDTQQMCDTLPTVLNLAAAGGIDLAAASDILGQGEVVREIFSKYLSGASAYGIAKELSERGRRACRWTTPPSSSSCQTRPTPAPCSCRRISFPRGIRGKGIGASCPCRFPRFGGCPFCHGVDY